MKKKKNKYLSLFIIIILVISLGYAFLNANLNINGTAKVNSNSWDIHFNNIVVNPDSVEIGTEDSAATITPSNTTEVTYSITLDKPGDFYEFTVDAVNAGTIDGMIDSITSKLNGVVISDSNPIPSYFNYIVTYVTGDDIQVNHVLRAGDTETYKVRLEFKRDINPEDLPNNASPVFSLTIVFVQEDGNGVEPVHPQSLYSVLKNEVDNNGLAREYTGVHRDSITKAPSQKIYHWYAEDDTEGVAITDKFNVIFADFCWQMIRTTDTGGVKLLYNGTPNNGSCDASNGDNIGLSAFNPSDDSVAYVGYQYNPNTLVRYTGFDVMQNGIFGEDVTYENGMYTLVNTTNRYGSNAHYRCPDDSVSTCSTVYYFNYSNYYVEITDGRNATQALADMVSNDSVNNTDSTIKIFIDSWYQTNLASYSSYLEDTIYCGSRNVVQLGGWNPFGGSAGSGTGATLNFIDPFTENYTLECVQDIDKFSVSNPKARLQYPIGLITYHEMRLMHNIKTHTPKNPFWLLSPRNADADSKVYTIGSSGYYGSGILGTNYGVRPAISLKSDASYSTGDGSVANPYIVILN